MNLFDLSGRVAIVTGGNGGIGFAIARGLARVGAAVAVAGRNEKKSEDAVSTLKELGARALSVKMDVCDERSCRAGIDQAAAEFGRLDILVNNAGTTVRKQPQDCTLQEWHTVMDTNLTSAFVCAQAAYPHMVKAGGGKIISIGSMLSIFGASFAAAYGASKGGIVQLTKSLASAWAKDNIQVNAILPGWIHTELTVAARRQVAGLHEKVLARTPAGRWGDARDFEGIAIFLAAPASDFITGAAVPVDGGYSIQA